MAHLFGKFDQENRGWISKRALLELFNKYGIRISMAELNSYMRIVEAKGPELSVEKFKRCAQDERAQACFRRLMNKSNERNPD